MKRTSRPSCRLKNKAQTEPAILGTSSVAGSQNHRSICKAWNISVNPTNQVSHARDAIMTAKQTPPSGTYTCMDYRQEMILLALQKKLQQPGLTEEETHRLIEEISRLEEVLGL